MPLSQGTSKESFEKNIKEMISSGHPAAQAVAASLKQRALSKKKKEKK